MKIDLHVHSTASDGTDSPAELVACAQAAGLDAIALADHDTHRGLSEAQAAGERLGLAVLSAFELSAHARVAESGETWPVHVLGYGCQPDDPALATELVLIRQGRANRIPAILAQLQAAGFPVTLAEVEAQAGDAQVIGRPHVADAMVARGYVADRDEAFALYLRDGGPVLSSRYTPEAADAIDLIRQAGGVPVLAHPWARGGRAWMPPERIRELAEEHGLQGLEADHLGHDDEARAGLRVLADRLGLLATGSSDYHGTGKRDNPLGAYTTDPAVYAELLRRCAIA
ncbi:MAG: PHP domain-containing protein [Propionibacteriaceae bacterium]|jgi:predicted metal-dependent phosphoesterase TrpH|nr:PHP domain-containing protein [Propionibacteriaceae bacterium]